MAAKINGIDMEINYVAVTLCTRIDVNGTMQAFLRVVRNLPASKMTGASVYKSAAPRCRHRQSRVTSGRRLVVALFLVSSMTSSRQVRAADDVTASTNSPTSSPTTAALASLNRNGPKRGAIDKDVRDPSGSYDDWSSEDA